MKSVNVDIAIEIGRKQMTSLTGSLTEGFRLKINEVATMKAPKDAKKRKVAEVFNTELILSRVICHSADKVKINDLFSYELAPAPTALFKDTGERTYHRFQADLKNALKVELSVRNIIPAATLKDGCAMIHRILYSPKGGKVSDLIFGLRSHVLKILSLSDVYIVLKKQENFTAPLNEWGSTVSVLMSQYNETAYFSPLSLQELLVLI